MKDQQLGVEVKNSNGQNPPDRDDSYALLVPYSENADHQSQIDADSYFDDKFPPGYRFKPFDSELVVFYLRRKILNETLPPNRIKEVELYKFSPETLTGNSKPLGENEWYFFTPRDRKYKNGKRPNRAAAEGYWKATGADKRVQYNNVVVGFKKSLVFYRGKPPKGDKTDWIMHEFRVDTPPRIRSSGSDMRLDDWVLCRIYKKKEQDKDKSGRTVMAEQADSNQDDQQSEEFDDNGALDIVIDPTMLPKETPMPHGLMPHGPGPITHGSGLIDVSSFYHQRGFSDAHDNVLIYPQNTFNPYSHHWPPSIAPYTQYHPMSQTMSQNSTRPLMFSTSNQIPNQLVESSPSLTFQSSERKIKFEQFHGRPEDEYLIIPPEENCFEPLLHNSTKF